MGATALHRAVASLQVSVLYPMLQDASGKVAGTVKDYRGYTAHDPTVRTAALLSPRRAIEMSVSQSWPSKAQCPLDAS